MTTPSEPRPNGFSEVTGEICYDLPSAYIPHSATGLLHLPRFLGKIRKHLKGELPKSYQRNFCKGFDRFLCMHLGVTPEQVIACVRETQTEAELLALAHGDDAAKATFATLAMALRRSPALAQLLVSPHRDVLTEAARAESPRSACKAAMPKPTPQSRKNHRRVRCA